MKLDWNAPILPGKAMLNLALETSFDDCLALFKTYQNSDNLVKFKNSPLMRLIIDDSKEVITLNSLDIWERNWPGELAHFYFKNEKLRRITINFYKDEFSKGEIHNCRLGSKIAELLPYYELIYDDGDESIFAYLNDVYTGLELYGSCCDLTQDPDQIIAGVVVSNIHLD